MNDWENARDMILQDIAPIGLEPLAGFDAPPHEAVNTVEFYVTNGTYKFRYGMPKALLANRAFVRAAITAGTDFIKEGSQKP